MSFNAFVGGIQPGGLTNDFEVKILICFLLVNIEEKLTFDQLNEIFQNTGLVNYFEFAESMSDLIKTGHIGKEQTDEGELYTITETGAITARTFEKTLPLTVREKTLEAARKLVRAQKCMDELQISYDSAPDGYILHLVMKDIGSDLLDMKMFLPTEEECVRVKEKIEDDPAQIYSNILMAIMM